MDIEHLAKGQLTIKYKSTGKVVESTQIPQGLRPIVESLLTGKCDKVVYGKLTGESKRYIDRFIAQAKISFDVAETQREKEIEKYHILCGEIEAGNNSEEIKRMLHQSAVRLFELKFITKNKYLQIKHELGV